MTKEEKNQKIIDNMLVKVEKIVKEVSSEELEEKNEKKKIVNLVLAELEKEINDEN